MEGEDTARHVYMDRDKVQMEELQQAVCKRDEMIQQLSAQLQQVAHARTQQVEHGYSADTMATEVQLLHTRLQNAGQMLQSQTEKQALTSQALQETTQEVLALRQIVTDKDAVMKQLAENLEVISQEYANLKDSHKASKLREKQTNEVVQKLMVDAEQMRKKNVSSPSDLSSLTPPVVAPGMVSESAVEARMDTLRNQLEETYGVHIAQMKQAVTEQFHQEKMALTEQLNQEKDQLHTEITTMKEAQENCSSQNEEYRRKLQDYENMDIKMNSLQEECNAYQSHIDQLTEALTNSQSQIEDYHRKLQDSENMAAKVIELQQECTSYKSLNDELKNKINIQQDSVVSLQTELQTLTSENVWQRDQMNLLSQDLDAQNTEIEEAFLEKSQYIEKASKLEEQLENSKGEYEMYKCKSDQLEDLVSSLKDELQQSETSRQNVDSFVQTLDRTPVVEVDNLTESESGANSVVGELQADEVSLVASTSHSLEQSHASVAEDISDSVMPSQTAMCVQEEITLESSTLTQCVQSFEDSSTIEFPQEILSSTVEPNLSCDPSDDSEATLTSGSQNSSMNELSGRHEWNAGQLKDYVVEIESLKCELAKVLDQRTFAQSEIEKLCDEILVLKDRGNQAEVGLREVDYIKSENEAFQKEREEQIESNLTLMADVQSAHLVIENLESEKESLSNELQSTLQEVIHLVASKQTLEEENTDIGAQYQELYVTNQRLIAELELLRQEGAVSVQSPPDPSHVRNNTSRGGHHSSNITESDSSLSSDLSSGQSSHADSDNASRQPSCQSSLDQGHLTELDSGQISQFDSSFYFGRQEEVPMQTPSTDVSDITVNQSVKSEHGKSNQIMRTVSGKSKSRSQSDSNEKGEIHKKKKTQLEQEIVEMQIHVDDLHSMRANLLEQVEHLKKEAKTREKENLKTSSNYTTDTGKTTEDLEEQNRILQEENDLLSRQANALKWQVSELQGDNEKKKSSERIPLEELIVENFMQTEEAIGGGSEDPRAQPAFHLSQDSIEQEVVLNLSGSQNSIGQEHVVEDMIMTTGVKETFGVEMSSTMSLDSIDQVDNDPGVNDISSDSIDGDMTRPGVEARHQEMVRNSFCMLSVVPLVDVPSYSGGAGNSPLTDDTCLTDDTTPSDKKLDSLSSKPEPVEHTNIGILDSSNTNSASVQGEDTRIKTCRRDYLGDGTCEANKCDSDDQYFDIAQKSEELNDHTDIKCMKPSHDRATSDISILRQQLTENFEGIRVMTEANRDMRKRLYSLLTSCDTLRRENLTMCSDAQEGKSELSSLQNECDSLQDTVERYQSEVIDLLTRSNYDCVKPEVDVNLSGLKEEFGDMSQMCTSLRHDAEMKLTDKEKELEFMTKKCYGSEVEIQSLHTLLDDLSKKELESEETAKSQIHDLQDINEELKQENCQLIQEKDRLRHLKSSLDLELCDKQEQDVRDLKEQNLNLSASVQKLQEELNSKEKERENLAHSLEENKTKFIRNKAKLARMEKSNTGKNIEAIRQLESLLQTKEEEKQQLKEQLENVIMKMVDDNSALKEILDRTVDQLRLEKVESEEMCRVVEGIMEKNRELSEHVKTINTDIESLKEERNSSEEKLLSSVQLLEEKLSITMQECEDLAENLNTERSNLAIAEKDSMAFKMQLEKVKEHKCFVEEKHASAIQILEHELASCEEECRNLGQLLEKEKCTASALEGELTDARISCEKTLTAYREMEEECQKLRESLQAECTALENEIVSLKSVINRERDNHSEREVEVAKIFESMQEELETKRIMDRNSDELNVKCHQLETILESLNSRVEHDRETTQMEKNVMKQSMQKLQADLEGCLEQERTLFQNERLELVNKCEKLQESLSAMEQHLDSLNLEYRCKFEDNCMEKEELEKELENQRELFAIERASFKSDRSSLVEQCDELETEKTKMEQCLVRERECVVLERQSLSVKCNQLLTEKEHLEVEVQTIASQLQEEQCEKTSVQETLELAVSDLKHQIDILKKEFGNEKEKVQIDIDALQSEKATLEQRCIESEESGLSLGSELSQWRGKCNELEARIAEMTLLHDDAVANLIAKCQEDITNLTSKHDQEISNLTSSHRNSINSLEETSEHLAKDVEKLQQEREHFITKYTMECTDMELKVSMLQEDNTNLRNLVEELKNKRDKIEKDLSDEKQTMDEQHAKLHEKLTAKEAGMDALNTNMETFNSKCRELEMINQELAGKLKETQENMEIACKENVHASVEIQKYKESMMDFEKNIEGVSGQLGESDQRICELEKCIESFQEELTVATESKDFYQSELASATDSLKQVIDVRETLSSERDSLKCEVEMLTYNENELLSQLESLKNKVAEQETINDEFMNKMKLSTAERDAEVVKNKELMTEIKLRNERCETLIVTREQLLRAIDASEQLHRQLSEEGETLRTEKESLIQECTELREKERLYTQLTKDSELLEKENKALIQECSELRNKEHDLQRTLKQKDEQFTLKVNELKCQSKAEILAKHDELFERNQNLEARNTSLVLEIKQLKETFEQERTEQLGVHEAMTEALSDMQLKYESVLTLMEDTKMECNKETEILRVQLTLVNSDVMAMKSSLQVMEEEQLCDQELRPTESQDNCNEFNKSRKDMKNQQVSSGSRTLSSLSPLEVSNVESGFFQIETTLDEDSRTQYEKHIEDLMAELELVKFERKRDQDVHDKAVQELYRKLQELEVGIDVIEMVVPEEGMNCATKPGFEDQTEAKGIEGSGDIEAGCLSEQDTDDVIEAQVEDRLIRRMEGLKYELEEQYTLEARKKEAAITQKCDEEVRKYKKEMEVYMKHKMETIRAEKDTVFLKAMQKVNRDADRRIKQELERQRLKFLEEKADDKGDDSSDGTGVGDQIGEVVQKLHKENQDLAEARDALLQQVALSHLHQEHLQGELRFMREDSEERIHGDVPGDLLSVDGGDYIQELDVDGDQSKFSYRSQSLMLDWELSPQASFDYEHEEGDALEFVQHFHCRRPRCRLIRQKYQELYDAVTKPDSGSSSVRDEADNQSGFKPEDDSCTDVAGKHFVNTEQGFQAERRSGEGSFHPEEKFITCESQELSQENSFKDSTGLVVQPTESNFSTTNSGFLPEIDSHLDNIPSTKVSKCAVIPNEKQNIVLENETGFKPEEEFKDKIDALIVCGVGDAEDKFLPEEDVLDNKDDYSDEVFERSAGVRIDQSNIHAEDNTLLIGSVTAQEHRSVETEGFQPEIEFHLESSARRPSRSEVVEGFKCEFNEAEDIFGAGDGFKPEETFSPEQDSVGNEMLVSPTSELESALVREALCNAAATAHVTDPFLRRKERFISDIPGKVQPGLITRQLEVVISSSDIEDTHIGDGVSTGSPEEELLAISDVTQSSSHQPRQNLSPPRTIHRDRTKTSDRPPRAKSSKSPKSGKTNDDKKLHRVQKDNTILQEKVNSLLKEKQSLMEREREIKLQLENEMLSRQHFEQELMGMNEHFERMTVRKVESEVSDTTELAASGVCVSESSKMNKSVASKTKESEMYKTAESEASKRTKLEVSVMELEASEVSVSEDSEITTSEISKIMDFETSKMTESDIKQKDDIIRRLETEIEGMRDLKDLELQCRSLQMELKSSAKQSCDKEELFNKEGQHFVSTKKSLEDTVKELDKALVFEQSCALTEKTESEKEIAELKQRIVTLSPEQSDQEIQVDLLVSDITEDIVSDADKKEHSESHVSDQDLNTQVDILESQVTELVSDKKQLRQRCKDLEIMLRETQTVALREKTELDKELESIEGRTLILTSANQDLQEKFLELSNQQKHLVHEKALLLDEKFSMECRVNEIVQDHQNLQTTCADLQDFAQKSKEILVTMETQVRTLEGNLCDMTAAKEELYLKCMELESRLRLHEGSSEVSNLQEEGESEGSGSWSEATEQVGTEETGRKVDWQGQTVRLEKLEKLLEEKDQYICKLENDLDQIKPSKRQKEYQQMKLELEKTLKEKDSYIRKLEEHFLRQGHNQPSAVAGPEPSSLATEASSSSGSMEPQFVSDTVEDYPTESTSASVGDFSDTEMHIEELADHSMVSMADHSPVSMADLSGVSVTGQSLVSVGEASTTPTVFASSPTDEQGSTTMAGHMPQVTTVISHSSPLPSPRVTFPHPRSTSSHAGSFTSSDRIQAGFVPEEDGHLESKHSELVDEIARLRKDLSETKAIYTQENVLLKEALDRDGSKRRSSVGSMSFESDSTVEVTRLRQKVGALEETNKMLQIENGRWLRQLHDQECVVIELRELLGRDSTDTDDTESVFGTQIKILQNQRDHLLENIREFESKNQRLTHKLGDNSILEESLRREKDLLYVKLCEKEDLERELSEKRLALERQRHSQEQLEEILYHKNITEKELMRQKRLLEEELSEIESKLREKEELLEQQKNTLLRDIRGSSPPQLLSGSFSVVLNHDGSPAASTFYMEGTPSSAMEGKPSPATPNKPSTVTPKTPEMAVSPGQIGHLEQQLQEAERHHASAIENLRERLSVDRGVQLKDSRQRSRVTGPSNKSEKFHKRLDT